MSLEESKTDVSAPRSTPSSDSNTGSGNKDSKQMEFMGEDSLNTSPNKEVGAKQAIDINIIEDDRVVQRAAEQWTPNDKERMVEVIQIVFNDGSTWHWPLREWDSDPAFARQHFIEQYAPEVIRWQAAQNGEDPDEVIANSIFGTEEIEPEWAERVGDVELSEENRKWFNENASYVGNLLRKVGSSGKDIDIDASGLDWTEDW